jgi:hypothetical protein
MTLVFGTEEYVIQLGKIEAQIREIGQELLQTLIYPVGDSELFAVNEPSEITL